jgi:hypothetical protein
MMRWLGITLRWLLAVIVATAAASAAHSWAVQQQLAALGVAIPAGDALASGVDDLVGQGPAVGAILGIALAVGFLVAAWLGPRLKVPARLAYPLAGTVAVAATLWIMRQQMQITPIAGAREALGFALISLGGGLGGLVFALTRRR